ncbi:MAG TPA: nitroreductase family deazaflavin-dependent oxidoreductase [Candidatus Dormibacteraeota bacterium]|jgi:deazaflavin-dependent oxidoreductase (nitroreductase family)|nr:nitroreductase family deazaflavin-dependent oxidoreductase [Candidatus Dormibacteraeota bacterium]
MTDEDPRKHYQRGGNLMDRIMNGTVSWLVGLGVDIRGSRMLYVRGRKSGEWRSTPVNLLVLDGRRYLVSPRGHSQWVRNLRATGGGELRIGRRVEAFRATELPDDRKPELLRDYLRRWAFEVNAFFDGVGANSPDSELIRIAPRHPVFELSPAEAEAEADRVS